MKIHTILENTACRPELTAEHGLSLFIETGCHTVLFDMGQTDAFASNAEKMGLDLSKVDIAVISHGHYDHGGGLRTFLDINRHAPVYISRHAFGSFYGGARKYIGLDRDMMNSDRLIFTEDVREIGTGLTLYSCNDRENVLPVNPYGLTRMHEGQLVPDIFLHEQYLQIDENGKRIIVSGCSHKGVLNIISWMEPDIFFGGFHFKDVEDEAVLRDAADKLMRRETMYYTGHCTGKAQFDILKSYMGARLGALSTGGTITV